MKEEHTHRLYELILVHTNGAKVKPIEVFKEVNAIEIPKGATNGDVIKAMFPNIRKGELEYTYVECIKLPCHSKHDTGLLIDKEWWNAPYESEDKK